PYSANARAWPVRARRRHIRRGVGSARRQRWTTRGPIAPPPRWFRHRRSRWPEASRRTRPAGLTTRISDRPLLPDAHDQSVFYRGNFLTPFARGPFEAGHAPGVEGDALQHVLRPFQLRVMHAQNFLALVLLQAVQSTRAAPQEQRLFFLRAHGHDDVRRDALLVNDLVAGGVILRRRQAQGRAVSQRQDFLHRAFAEGLLADDDRVRNTRRRRVLQAASDDFRSARAAVVDENRQRQVRMRTSAGSV